MSSDAVQILNTIDNTRVTQKDYADVQWKYINDVDNGANGTQLRFVTTTLKPQFVDYHNAYIDVPVDIASSDVGTPYDGSEAIAWRDSILQIFNQINIATDSGQVLVNENVSPYFINMIRPRLENDFDYFEVEGGQLGMGREVDHWLTRQTYGSDKGWSVAGRNVLNSNWSTGTTFVHGTDAVWNDPNEFLYANVAATNPSPANPAITAAAGAVSVPYAPNKYFNKSYANRIALFKNMMTFNTSTNSYQGRALIPLRFTHDFYQQLNMAIINMGFNMQYFFSQPNKTVASSTAFPPLLINDGFTGVTIKQPLIKYSHTVNPEPARLHYRSLKFDAADTRRMQEKLTENFVKSINFISTDNYQDRAGSAGTTLAPGTSTWFNQEIISSIVYPLRIWALFYPTPAVQNGGFASRWPMSVTPYELKDANLLINNNPYFINSLLWPHQHWMQLKDQFVNGTSGAIKYEQFVLGNRWHVFDVQRLGLERITSPTEPVALQLQGNLTCDSNVLAGNVSVVYLIERMNEVTFRFSSNDVSVVVGNISLNNTA